MVKLSDIEKTNGKKDSDTLAHLVNDLFDIQRDYARTIINRLTERNILYYIGEQWIDFLPYAGTFKRRIDIPAFMPTPTNGEIKDFVRSLKSMLLNQKLVPTVSPNTNEDEDVRAAELGAKLLTWMDGINDSEFADEKEKNVVWMGVSGTTFLRTYPDMNSGKWFLTKDGIIKTGEVVTKSVNPFSVRLDYSGERLRDKRWIGVQTLQAKEWVEDIFKVKITGPQSPDIIDYERKLMKLVSQVSPFKGGNIDSQGYEEDTDLVLLREVEYRPSDKYSNGRYMVICGTDTLVDVDRMPIKANKGDFYYSFTDFHYDYVPGRYWADAPINDLISDCQAINEILQCLALNRKGIGRPRVVTPSDIHISKINEGGFGFLQLKYDSLLAGGQRPQIESGLPLPGQIIDELTLHKTNIQDVSGDPKNILKGQAPSATSSGIQIDILRETAEKGHYPDIERYNRAMGRVYKKRLLLASELYTEERQLKISGRGNRLEIMAFKAADLRGNTDVTMELDSGVSTTRAGQTNLLMQLADKGYFGPLEMNDELREEFLRRLGISGFTSQSNVDFERAEKENTAISMGKPENIFLLDPQQMGEDGTPLVLNDDPLFKYDPPLIHYEIHRRKIMSDEFKSWPLKAQTILIGHAEIHKAMIPPAQPMPQEGETEAPQGQPKSSPAVETSPMQKLGG